MPKLFLNISLIDFRSGGETGPQGVTREHLHTLFVGPVDWTDTGFQHQLLDQAHHMLVRQALGPDTRIVPINPPKDRPGTNLRKMEPLFESVDGAGLFGGSTTDLDLAPAGLALDVQHGAAVEEFDISSAVIVKTLTIVLADVETDDLGAAESARVAQQNDGPVAQVPQSECEGGHHLQHILGQHRFFLLWWFGVLSLDPSPNRGDVAVLEVKREPARPVVG